MNDREKRLGKIKGSTDKITIFTSLGHAYLNQGITFILNLLDLLCVNVVDLFCGAGGFSLGFKKAGFNILLGVDISQDALETFQANFKDSLTLQANIRSLTGIDIIAKVGEKIDVVIGGSPCQGFSSRGKRQQADPRNDLAFDFFRIVKEISPEIFVFENVPGILEKNNSDRFEELLRTIRRLNYNFCLDVLNASDYGTPQVRKRLIIIGSRKKNVIFLPLKRKRDDYILKSENVNIKRDVMPIVNKRISALEALDDIAIEKVESSLIDYDKISKSVYQEEMRNKSPRLCNHKTIKHRESTIELIKKFSPGDSIKNLQCETKKQTMNRLHDKLPAKTLTSCDNDLIHYSLNRMVTIREMARLQGFPDDFIFHGKRTTGGKRRRIDCCQVQQVANSVPPLLSQVLAECILKTLECESNNNLKEFIKKLNYN